MALPFGRIPQEPIDRAGRPPGTHSPWWGVLLALAAAAMIVWAAFSTYPTRPPMTHAEMVEAVTHAGVTRTPGTGPAGQPGGIQKVVNPPSDCPT